MLILACMGLCKGATASDWADWASEWVDLKASLTQQIQYNDNMLISPTQPQGTLGYFLNPSLTVSHKTESFDINIKAQGNIRRYDNSLYDCENYALGLNSQYKTRRSVFKMTGSYGISCAYSQQVQQTGVIIPGVQSTNINLAPSWAWQWTPRDQLSLGVMYTNRIYNGGASSTKGTNSTASTSYQNYDSYTINLGFNHVWDRDLSLNGGLYFMNSQYMGKNASTQQSLGLQLGGQYSISQHWSANFSAGLRRTDIQSNSVSASSSNTTSMSPLGNFSVSYQDRFSSFSTGYSSTIMPSALGQTLQTQSVYAMYSYKITPHLSLSNSSIALQSDGIGGQPTIGTKASNYGRETFTNTVMFTWDFAKAWQLRGNYSYRWQKLQQQTAAESNIVMLSINFAFDEPEDLGIGRYNLFDSTSVYSGSIESQGQWF